MYKRILPALVAGFIGIAADAQIAFTNNNTLLTGSYGNPACVVDMNGDHLDDVVRMNGPQLTIAYQQTGGGFVQGSFATTQSNNLRSLCAGDLDNNGYNDICIGDSSHVSFLYANNTGTSYFNLYYPDPIHSQRNTMADVDNDGQLDAFVCNLDGQSRPYRNSGGLVGADQSLINTLAAAGNSAAIWCDYDADGDADLYITKGLDGALPGSPERVNLLYRNDGGGTFTEVGLAAGIADDEQGGSTLFEDFDNDGDFDAFIKNVAGQNRFMLNNGNGTFTDIIGSTGIYPLAFGIDEILAADFDNDGWVDLILPSPTGTYRNNGDLTFSLMASVPNNGGVGDLNDDGWLDLVFGFNIYFNNGGTNHWVKVELDGLQSNNNGIGSRIELYGSWGRQIHEVRSGEGFAHMNSLHAHFGIGSATAIDSMVVRWPSGTVTHVPQPAIDQLHVIPEAECIGAPAVIQSIGNTVLCVGQTVTLEATAPYSIYAWSNGAITPTITIDQPGDYSLVAYDANNCIAQSNVLTIQVQTAEIPEITVNGGTTFCEGFPVELVSSVATNIEWSNGLSDQTILADVGGTYTVTSAGPCGVFTSAPVEMIMNPAPAVPVANDVSIPAPGVATLSATGDSILWYDALGATTSIGSGNIWDTPFLNSTTSFWCEENAMYGGSLETGGKPDNSGGGGLPASGAYVWFNATEPFTILEVTVYALSDGMRTIQLCDSSGAVLQTININILTGTQVLALDFDVPVGNYLSLRLPQANLYRNNSGVSYPYAIGMVGTMFDTPFGTSYYYYFYNWQIQKAVMLCPSAREEVVVTVGPVGMSETGAPQLGVHPVPSTDALHVEGVLVNDRLRLTDALGRVVLERMAKDQGSMVIDVSAFPAGNYSLVVVGTERTVSRKVVLVR
ncbi:MAG: FG-GAP-like repeat-containing protein [Flavobacteriales bacterium]